MKILISEKLSPHKYKTPEGYLICVDAVLARTGKQTYKRCEIFNDDSEEEIEVDRKPEEVFSEATLASFENKPVTLEHPNEDVNSGNFKDYAVGFVRDVKRGVVDGQDVILGTLVIQDEEVINEIENGEHTELSCGYDADIKDEKNPQQRNIRGNHVALCECGRAGNARIVDSVSNNIIGDSVESDFEDITNMSDAKELLKRYGIDLIKKDNRNYVLRKGSKDYTFYVLDNPNEVRKDLIRAVKKLTMNDSKVRDAYYTIGGYAGKYDPMAMTDIKKAAKYGVNGSLERTSDGWQLVLRGTPANLRNVLENYFGLDASGIEDSMKDEKSTYTRVTENLEKNLDKFEDDDYKFKVANKYGRVIYSFKTREEAEHMISSLTKNGEYGYHIKDSKQVSEEEIKEYMKKTGFSYPDAKRALEEEDTDFVEKMRHHQYDEIKDDEFKYEINWKDTYSQIKYDDIFKGTSVKDVLEQLAKTVSMRGVGTANAYVNSIHRFNKDGSTSYYPRAYGKLNSMLGQTYDSCKARDSKINKIINLYKIAKKLR